MWKIKKRGKERVEKEEIKEHKGRKGGENMKEGNKEKEMKEQTRK